MDFLLVPQAQKEVFFSNTEELIKEEEKLEEKIANLKEKYGKQIITYGHYCLKILTYIKKISIIKYHIVLFKNK